MQLTKHTDYAFRTLLYLASMKAERTTIKQISTTFSLSKSHLMKIVQKLGAHGYIQTTRGKNGGIQLARPASEIGLREIIELMELTLEPLDCEGLDCILVPACLLRKHLSGAQEAYLAYLEHYTIQDLVHPQTSNLIFLDTIE